MFAGKKNFQIFAQFWFHWSIGCHIFLKSMNRSFPEDILGGLGGVFGNAKQGDLVLRRFHSFLVLGGQMDPVDVKQHKLFIQ